MPPLSIPQKHQPLNAPIATRLPSALGGDPFNSLSKRRSHGNIDRGVHERCKLLSQLLDLRVINIEQYGPRYLTLFAMKLSGEICRR